MKRRNFLKFIGAAFVAPKFALETIEKFDKSSLVSLFEKYPITYDWVSYGHSIWIGGASPYLTQELLEDIIVDIEKAAKKAMEVEYATAFNNSFTRTY